MSVTDDAESDASDDFLLEKLKERLVDPLVASDLSAASSSDEEPDDEDVETDDSGVETDDPETDDEETDDENKTENKFDGVSGDESDVFTKNSELVVGDLLSSYVDKPLLQSLRDAPESAHSEPVIAPDAPVSAPDAPEIAPDVPEIAQNALEIAPDALEIAPDAPEIAQNAPEIAPDAPESAPDALEIAPDAPESAPDALEIAPDVPESAQDALEIAHIEPEIAHIEPEIAPDAPDAPEIAQIEPEIAHSETEIAPDAPEIAPDAPEIAPDAPEIAPECAEQVTKSVPNPNLNVTAKSIIEISIGPRLIDIPVLFTDDLAYVRLHSLGDHADGEYLLAVDELQSTAVFLTPTGLFIPNIAVKLCDFPATLVDLVVCAVEALLDPRAFMRLRAAGAQPAGTPVLATFPPLMRSIALGSRRHNLRTAPDLTRLFAQHF